MEKGKRKLSLEQKLYYAQKRAIVSCDRMLSFIKTGGMGDVGNRPQENPIII
jgi:hypothetical protein